MNALLSLVLSMGHNRVAGALRVDSIGSPSPSESDDSGSEHRYDDERERDAFDDHLEVVVTEAERLAHVASIPLLQQQLLSGSNPAG